MEQRWEALKKNHHFDDEPSAKKSILNLKKKKKCQEIKYSNDRVPTFNIAFIFFYFLFLPIDRSLVFEEPSAKKSILNFFLKKKSAKKSNTQMIESQLSTLLLFIYLFFIYL